VLVGGKRPYLLEKGLEIRWFQGKLMVRRFNEHWANILGHRVDLEATNETALLEVQLDDLKKFAAIDE
jgi:uncharacterized protein (DUF2237 family)